MPKKSVRKRIGKKDCVIEERLRGHQGQPYERPLAVRAKQRADRLSERREPARTQPDPRQIGWRDHFAAAPEAGLDTARNRLGLLSAMMRHQPARALRYP
jgi:hypothetical protein